MCAGKVGGSGSRVGQYLGKVGLVCGLLWFIVNLLTQFS